MKDLVGQPWRASSTELLSWILDVLSGVLVRLDTCCGGNNIHLVVCSKEREIDVWAVVVSSAGRRQRVTWHRSSASLTGLQEFSSRIL